MNEPKAYKSQEEQVVLRWVAPSRPTLTLQSYTPKLLILFGILFSLLFLFLNDKVLIAGTWAIIFSVYVWLKTPPQHVENKITQFGIYWYGSFIPFSAVFGFSLEKNEKQQLVRLLLSPTGFSHVDLMLPEEKIERDKIVNYLHERLPYIEKVPRSTLEKFGGFLARLVGFSPVR